MSKCNKIISSIVLICFIFNTAISDFAFGQSPNSNMTDKLAAQSKFSNIQPIANKDVGDIELWFGAALNYINNHGLGITRENLQKFADMPGNLPGRTIYQLKDTNFFIHEIPPVENGVLTIKTTRSDFVRGPRTYIIEYSSANQRLDVYPEGGSKQRTATRDYVAGGNSNAHGLVRDMKPDYKVDINGNIEMTYYRIESDPKTRELKAKFGFRAPEEVTVYRSEIYENHEWKRAFDRSRAGKKKGGNVVLSACNGQGFVLTVGDKKIANVTVLFPPNATNVKVVIDAPDDISVYARKVEKPAKAVGDRHARGKSPNDAKAVIVLYEQLQKGPFTIDDFIKAYLWVRDTYSELEFDDVAEKYPDSIARIDLGALIAEGFLTWPPDRRRANTYVLTPKAIEMLPEIKTKAEQYEPMALRLAKTLKDLKTKQVDIDDLIRETCYGLLDAIDTATLTAVPDSNRIRPGQIYTALNNSVYDLEFFICVGRPLADGKAEFVRIGRYPQAKGLVRLMNTEWMSTVGLNRVILKYPRKTLRSHLERAEGLARAKAAVEREQAELVEENRLAREKVRLDEATAGKTQSAHSSILEDAEINIRRAANIMNLDPELLELILKPKKITSVKFEIPLDSGERKTFYAFRVLQNDALGAGKGGIRWLVVTGETLEEAMKTAAGLATLMTIKNAVINIPYGGAKGDIVIPVGDYTLNDQARIIRAFSHELTKERAIGPFIDVPAPDQGTDARMMAWFLDQNLADLTERGEIFDKTIEAELKRVKTSDDPQKTPFLDRYVEVLDNDKDGVLQGFELGTITGKPIGKGGSESRTKATGFGGFLALKNVLRHFELVDDFDKDTVGRTLNKKVREVLKKGLKHMTAAVQGTGNVGEYHAWELYRAGVPIIILEDAVLEGKEHINYTLYHPDGIDIELLNKNLDRLPNGRWASLKTLKDEFLRTSGYRLIRNDKRFFWKTYTNIKVPAAAESVITSENAEDVNCEIVNELANDPTTPDADRRLRERGILIIPDSFANTGGVGFSYYEWLQNIEGRYHKGATLDKMFEERMSIEADVLFAFAEKYRTDLRMAAYIMYLARVSNAEIARSDELSNKFTGKNPYMYYGELGLAPATVEELNRMIMQGKFDQFINKTDELKSREIDAIAGRVLDKLSDEETGFVLASGATTSGKLGFVVSLTNRLRSAGRRVIRLNFDALKLADLEALRDGKAITAIDYIAGKKMTRTIMPKRGDIFVVEGNYAIEDEVLNAIPEKNRITMWINKIPSVKLEDNWPLTSLDDRLLGNILTVYHTEGREAIDVIRGWPAERKVQMERVFPTWVNADITFNAYLPYELPIIKFYVEDMVTKAMEIARRDNDKTSIKIIERLQRTLKGVIAVKIPDNISVNPIIQQYIGDDRFYGALMDLNNTQAAMENNSVESIARVAVEMIRNKIAKQAEIPDPIRNFVIPAYVTNVMPSEERLVVDGLKLELKNVSSASSESDIERQVRDFVQELIGKYPFLRVDSYHFTEFKKGMIAQDAAWETGLFIRAHENVESDVATAQPAVDIPVEQEALRQLGGMRVEGWGPDTDAAKEEQAARAVTWNQIHGWLTGKRYEEVKNVFTVLARIYYKENTKDLYALTAGGEVGSTLSMVSAALSVSSEGNEFLCSDIFLKGMSGLTRVLLYRDFGLPIQGRRIAISDNQYHVEILGQTSHLEVDTDKRWAWYFDERGVEVINFYYYPKFTAPLCVGSLAKAESRAALTVRVATALEAIMKLVPSGLLEGFLNIDVVAQAVKDIGCPENITTTDKKSVLIFSKIATFGEKNPNGSYEKGIGPILPSLIKSDIKVAVIAETQEEIDFINELNEISNLSGNRRIVPAPSVAKARSMIPNGRYYYLKVAKEDPAELDGVTSITIIVQKILDAIGAIMKIPATELANIHEAARKFAEAA